MIMDAAQVGVTIGTTRGTLDHSGIQVTDARAVDARGIGELEAVGKVELVVQACTGHKVVEVSLKGVLIAARIGGTQVAVLVAQSGTRSPGSAGEGVAHVGSPHLGDVLVAHVGVIIDAQIVKHIVAAVEAVDILGTGLDFVFLGQGTRPVKLHGVFIEVLLAVLVDASIGNGHIHKVGVSGVVLVLVVPCREHVAQRDGLALEARATLVVHTAVQAVAVSLGVVAHAVAID